MRPRGVPLGVVAVALAATVAGCASGPPHPTASLVALRTIPTNGACAGVGLAAVLHGDPADPDVAWLTAYPGAFGEPPGGRFHVVWPAGYGARFEPTLTIVDPVGAVGLVEGDFIDGGCVTGVEGTLLILAPADGFALDCGPMNVPECVSGRVAQAARKVEPGHRVARISFVDASGRFRVLYEDGSTSGGFTSSN